MTGSLPGDVAAASVGASVDRLSVRHDRAGVDLRAGLGEKPSQGAADGDHRRCDLVLASVSELEPLGSLPLDR